MRRVMRLVLLSFVGLQVIVVACNSPYSGEEQLPEDAGVDALDGALLVDRAVVDVADAAAPDVLEASNVAVGGKGHIEATEVTVAQFRQFKVGFTDAGSSFTKCGAKTGPNAGLCRTSESGASVVPVGSMTKCEGGYPGLFDMSGNVTNQKNSVDVGVRCCAP